MFNFVRTSKYYLSIILLLVFDVTPRREMVRRIVKSLSLRGNMWLYERVIKSADKKIKIYSYREFPNTEFITNGSGEGVLNSYRILSSKNEKLFEKIYFKNDVVWEKKKYFHKHVYPQLVDNDIKVPGLKKVIEGSYLEVTYSEYFNLKALEENHYFENAIDMAIRLTNVEIKNNSSLYSYNSDPLFKKIKGKFFNKLPDSIELFENIDSYIIKHVKRRLCHGDITITNLYQENILIDWDGYGFYPLSYEFGFILSQQDMIRELTFDDYMNLERELFNKVSSFADEENFKLSLPFFSSIFLCFFKSESFELPVKLLSLVENRYKKIITNKILN